MTTERPIDLDALTLDGGPRRRAARPAGDGARASPGAGSPWPASSPTPGADVTIYDGRPADELADAVAALEGRPVRLLAGPDVDPATAWAGAALVATSPSINPDYPTTEPRLRAALQALVAARRAATRPRRRSSRRRTCSCASARRRRSA